MQKTKRKRGRPGLSIQDVQAACERLQAQGRPVGPTTVRLETGRGSYETITRHLRALGYPGGRTRK